MKIKSVKKPVQFPELRGTLASMRYPCFGEIKYDGEACYIHYNYNGHKATIVTTNKYGTMRYDWPKLDGLAEVLKKANVIQALFQAELYFGDGKAGSLYSLLSHKTDDNLNLAIFDVNYLVKNEGGNVEAIIEGNKTPLIDRKELLGDIFKLNTCLTYPKLIASRTEAEEYFNAVISIGWEGVVLKQLDGFATYGPCPWVKMKKKDQNVFEVRYVDPVKERIEIASITKDNGCTKVTAVGVKCCDKDKSGLEVGDKVIIEHQGILSSGSLRHPVFISKEGEQ